MTAKVRNLQAYIDEKARAEWDYERTAERWELLDEAMAIVQELDSFMILRLMSQCRLRLTEMKK